MSVRDNAIAAQLAMVMNPEIMGQSITIKGVTVSGQKRHLGLEEMANWQAEDVRQEGVSCVTGFTALGFKPVLGSRIEVDGTKYYVRRAIVDGDKISMTFTRYLV